MKKLSKVLLNCSLFALMPALAGAAGTFYDGRTYQSPQTRYSQQSYTQRSSAYSQRGVSAYNRDRYSAYSNSGMGVKNAQGGATTKKQDKVQSVSASKGGFTLGAGFSHQTSVWQFEMKESGSILHYDNVDWNVFDVNAGYVFNAGNTPIQIAAGASYGMQSGETTMIDDDITNGGYFVTEWVDGTKCLQTDADGKCIKYEHLGNQMGNALSIGTSKDGSMLGLNAEIGLKDFFKWGNLKITPSVGWRYLKYELKTQNNRGLSMDIYDGQGGCFTVPGSDEVQCDTVFIFYDSAGNQYLAHRVDTTTNGDQYEGEINGYDEVPLPSDADGVVYEYVSAGGTYYYAQPDISHEYEVEWSGPYLALDMLYDINQNNSVNARLELGLPAYNAVGNQPYRFDWQHPKSVEDNTGVGGAFHLGLGANWSTAITDSVALSIGLTYDYYTVSDADAKTYLNEGYYMGVYNDILENKFAGDEETMLAENSIAQNIVKLQEDCPGWICTADGEIESFYKSMGIRVGLKAKF